MTLLAAIVFWFALVWAACGVLVLGGCLWFALTDWLGELEDRRDRAHAEFLLAVHTGRCVRPYDHMDPLEQLLLLPDAPEPSWRVQ